MQKQLASDCEGNVAKIKDYPAFSAKHIVIRPQLHGPQQRITEPFACFHLAGD